MKIDQLNYFVEVAKWEHLGRSAKLLNISPSAISHSIHQLENELGKKLFYREKQRLSLTQEGQLFQKKVSEILHQLQDLKDEMNNDSLLYQGHFRMGVNPVLTSGILIPHWTDIQKKYPRITSEIYALRSAEVMKGVLEGDLDLGLCFNPSNLSLFESHLIKKGQLLVSVKKGHIGLKKPELLNELPACAPKSYSEVENCEHHPVLKKLGLKMNVKNIFDNYFIAIDILLNSDSWTLLPDFMLESHSNQLKSVFSQQPNAPYSIYLISPKGRELRAPIRVLKEALLQI